MAKITVYTKDYCPYCNRAKDLLKRKNLPYEEINLETNPEEMLALKNRTGWRTMPQIFIDDTLVGGYQELAELDRQGGLEKLKD